MSVLTFVLLVSEPTSTVGVVLSRTEPRSESVLYSNQYCVSAPFGVTLPFKVAALAVTLVALPVVAAGADGLAGPDVLKFKIAPLTVPNWF